MHILTVKAGEGSSNCYTMSKFPSQGAICNEILPRLGWSIHIRAMPEERRYGRDPVELRWRKQ